MRRSAMAAVETDRISASADRGAGGVMVPLDETLRIDADLIAALDIPVVLVVGSYLGRLSHALTGFEALRARNVAIDRIVVNRPKTVIFR